MWSGPRNLSTAMMRSFGNRADTAVSDEPFYGAFLKTSGADHPMRDEVIAAMDCDWASVMRATSAGRRRRAGRSGTRSICGTIWSGRSAMTDFAGFTHAFLIRDPARMIASYLRKREAARFEDFGLDRQAEFFEREADRLGRAPPVVDANDVLADPEGTLTAFCAALGLAFDRGDARLAAGTAAPPTAPGRRTGMPGGRGVDRLRPARAAAGRSPRRGPPPRRSVPALLSAAGPPPSARGDLNPAGISPSRARLRARPCRACPGAGRPWA